MYSLKKHKIYQCTTSAEAIAGASSQSRASYMLITCSSRKCRSPRLREPCA
ncbi:hypothetical protein Hanom_Chr07g00608131 [Helianthus anomalus]